MRLISTFDSGTGNPVTSSFVVRFEKFLQIRKGLDAPKRAGAVPIDSEHESVEECGRHQVINSELVHLTSPMHWLGKRSLVDFSATVGAIATRVPGLVALDVGHVMGGSVGGEGAGERGQNEIFQTRISPLCVIRRHSYFTVWCRLTVATFPE
jgi:hypothetical protein